MAVPQFALIFGLASRGMFQRSGTFDPGNDKLLGPVALRAGGFGGKVPLLKWTTEKVGINFF